jgi:RecJ-like exonuclease
MLVCPRCTGTGHVHRQGSHLCRRCGGRGSVPSPTDPELTLTMRRRFHLFAWFASLAAAGAVAMWEVWR